MRSKFAATLFLLMVSVVHAEWIPLDIAVDTVVIGQVPLDVETDEQGQPHARRIQVYRLADLLLPYLEASKIRSLRDLAERFSEDIALEELNRVGIRPVFDGNELRLNLEIPIDQRQVRDFPLYASRDKAGLGLQNKPYSGYLNYSVQTGYTDEERPAIPSGKRDPTEGQFELVQNLGPVTLESTAAYREFENEPFQRNDTSLVHDDELRQMRYRAGDFYTGVQGFQSSLGAAGLQVQKQFNIRPELGSLTKRSALIQVRQSSLMEVYVNENLILRLRVNPGPYNLRDLPVLYGRNAVRVVLIDDVGGREEFNVDLMFDDQILARGVNDFSYQVGAPSYYLLNEKEYDNRLLSSFYHRYGVTDAWTIGAGYQNYRETEQFSAYTGLLTDWGTHFLDLAWYQDDLQRWGRAGRWRYTSPELKAGFIRQLRLYGSVEGRSREFRTIAYPAPLVSEFSEKYDLLLQQQLGAVGSLGLGFTQLNGQNGGTDDFTRRVTYQLYVTPHWIFDISYDWSQNQSQRDQILASLTWNEPVGRRSAAVAYDSAVRGTSVRYNRNNVKNYDDYRIGVQATHEDPYDRSSGQNADINAEYFGRIVETRLRLLGTRYGGSETRSAQLGFSSAFAWTRDGASLSRPISDAFAIVAPSGLGDSRLNIPNGSENDNIPLADREKLVFMNLTSYIETQLQIDSTSLPLGRYLEREAYVIKPGYRAGIYVPLQVTRAVSVRGRLTATETSMVQYAHGRVRTADGRIFSESFFTDEKGYFVLDGISYGKYVIELADPRLKRIEFEVREDGDSADNQVELGEILIEREAGT